MLLAVMLAASFQVQAGPLSRPCVIGIVGDHDRDGVVDYAVIGRRDPIQVSIRSGATDLELVRFATPVRPACELVIHGQHVRVLADLDGDGAAELAAHDAHAWLLDGRTGGVVRELRDGSMFLGVVDDLDQDGVLELAVSDISALGRLHANPSGIARIWSGSELTRIRGTVGCDDERFARIRDAQRSDEWVVRSTSSSSPWIVRRELEDRNNGDSAFWTPRIVISNANDGTTLWSRSFEFEVVDPEHGGYGDLRCAALPDLDDDGEPEFLLALPAHAFSPTTSRSFLGAISLRSGRELWRCRELEVEGLNSSLDLLPDRDGDASPEVLVSIAGEQEDAVVVLSGRSGVVLKRFVP